MIYVCNREGAIVTIPVFKPLLENDDMKACQEALTMGWLGMGSYVGEFERRLRDFIEASDRHVVAVSTGHAALHLALLLAGVGPGDEVITPSFNNVADLQAIKATGADPVLCDVDPVTLSIDPASAAEVIGPRTKAIIAMDYACHICSHRQLQALAGQHGLRLIHDAAHSFGSSHSKMKVGSFSDITMFSFDPIKTITCIDGGALVVRTEAEAEWLREARLIGMRQPSAVLYRNQRSWTYDVSHIGFRYHLANLHAVLGLSQLNKIERISETRQKSCRYYTERLNDIEELTLPQTDFTDITPFIYYVRVQAARRQEFREHLHAKGVDTGIHWQPGHWFSFFKEARRSDLSVTEQIGREIVTVPLHSAMSGKDTDQVVHAIRSFFHA